jgi:hypothetical protein
MIELFCALPAAVDDAFQHGMLGKPVAVAERAFDNQLTDLGTTPDGYHVYVYYRTPDHSMQSPYWYMVSVDGKIKGVGRTGTAPTTPAWLGAKFAKPGRFPVTLTSIMETTALRRNAFGAPLQAPVATPTPVPNLQLAPQQEPLIPDAPADGSDGAGDLPGNLVF